MRHASCGWVWGAMFVLYAGAASAEVRQVKFPSVQPANVTLSGHYQKPSGAGPFPAAILLHGGGGVEHHQTMFDYANEFEKLGMASLIFDSYKARNLPPPDRNQWPREVVFEVFGGRILDAYGAVRFLRAQPEIDRTRIVVIGFSDGGRVAIHVAAGYGHVGQPSFGGATQPRAAIGYYPGCHRATGGPMQPGGKRYLPEAATNIAAVKIPLLLHIAGKDDWPGSEPVLCTPVWERLAKPEAGPVTAFHYPDAGHTFDNPQLAGGRMAPRGIVEYNRNAANLSWQRTLEFLREKLELAGK